MAFSKTLLIALSALFVVAPISALPISSELLNRAPYDAAHLEPYDAYHSYYVAAGCTGKQGTQFFEDCCRPRLKGKLTDRPATCSGQTASSTVSAAESVSTQAVETEDEEVCTEDETETEDADCSDDETDETSTTVSSTVSPTPSSVADNAVVETPESTPTPSPTASPTTSSTPAPAPTAPSGGYDHTGHATFYYQNGVAGSCEIVHQDTDFIAAMTPSFNMKPGSGSGCGQKVEIMNPSNGKVITVTAVDTCPSCGATDDIDLSKSAFLALASGGEGEGMFSMKWRRV
jgi:hypothetical protein